MHYCTTAVCGVLCPRCQLPVVWEDWGDGVTPLEAKTHTLWGVYMVDCASSQTEWCGISKCS